MEEDELGKAEEGIGTAAGFDFIDTKGTLLFFVFLIFLMHSVEHRRRRRRRLRKEFRQDLFCQCKGCLRNVGSGAAEPQCNLTAESPGICSDLGICHERRNEEMLS